MFFRSRHSKKNQTLTVLSVAVILGGISGWTAVTAVGGQKASEPRPPIGAMPGDENGDGILSDTGSERVPSLIQATTDDGKLGYVKLLDLNQAGAGNPTEALALARTQRVIPVYAEDGVTIVGQLTEAVNSATVVLTQDDDATAALEKGEAVVRRAK